MASVVACDMCGEEQASMMQTNTANGDTIAVGDSCSLAFYLTIVQSITESMPADILAAHAAGLQPVIDALTTAVSAVANEDLSPDTTGHLSMAEMQPAETGVPGE